MVVASSSGWTRLPARSFIATSLIAASLLAIVPLVISLGFVANVDASDAWASAFSAWGANGDRTESDSPVWLVPIADHFGVANQPRASYGFPGTQRGHLEQVEQVGQVGQVDEFQGPTAPNGWSHRFPFVEFRHTNPDDPGRHIGKGEPMEGTSWLNRPWHVGFFLGAMNGDDVIDRQVDQHTAWYGGGRLGRDLDHYWGVEWRCGFSQPRVADINPAPGIRHSQDAMFDLDLLYYPWGDSRWRPYFLLGVGWAGFRFDDAQGTPIKDVTVTTPFGLGLKYCYRPQIALRLDVIDNLAFSSETVDTMHNVSVSFGVDFHFGGRRRSYFPWHPGVQPY